MSFRRYFAWLALSAFVLIAVTWFSSPSLFAQQRPKDLNWTHAFDMAARKFGEPGFTKDTKRYGVEAFRDNNNGLGIYISEVGSLSPAPGFSDLKLPVTSKGPEWLTGLDLPARKAGMKDFKTATTHAMEVFRDPNADNWVYITEKGWLAAHTSKVRGSPGATKTPKLVHSIDLSVRKGGVKEWKDAKKYGVEIYRDNVAGNLVYICDTGAIAVIPDLEGKPASELKPPEWLHGLDLACRKHNEPSFTKNTRKFGVEVFWDTGLNHLIFICETGHLAVAAAPKGVKAPTANVKEPTWTHGLNLKARKFGETEFTEKTAVWGAECFRDDNVGVTIYLNEIGTIGAVRNP
ncbi:MAG: hypothetical protein L0215_02475 [Gemmataceae bacterium]|nr:hypothetical protein [Gemmataceae bacterium]